MVKNCLLADSYRCIENRNVSDLEKSRNRVISHDPLLEASKLCILFSSAIPAAEEILQKPRLWILLKMSVLAFWVLYYVVFVYLNLILIYRSKWICLESGKDVD